ncbi:glycosyltransferase family A protein [Sphingobacterium sp.]|uniref:glycosyltransferase family 2 protein n=1 Tax=Sphingobacterium sp. TaxID=341027 RepID=UPI0031D7B1A3
MSHLVSIIIPCYNNADTIRETLDSVYNQSYKNIEVIVVDDGSLDNSGERIRERQIQNPNLILLTQENSGPAAARNYGASISTGHYLVFLDGDDKIHTDYISTCVGCFEQDPTLDLVYPVTELFENEEGIFNLADFDPQTILTQNCFPIVAMIRKKDFLENGQFDEKLRIAEDWEMWIRHTRKFPNVKKIQKTLFFYRKRATMNSISDLNKINNIIDDAHLYVYNKHYALYREVGWDIIDLLSSRREYLKYKNKYYNQWFKKLFLFFTGKMK